MPTRVRSHTKVNLGLAIGPVRPDGFHELSTVYQTLSLHEPVTVEARKASATRITLSSTHPRVPTDAGNTAWRMVERTLDALGIRAEVHIHIHMDVMHGYPWLVMDICRCMDTFMDVYGISL